MRRSAPFEKKVRKLFGGQMLPAGLEWGLQGCIQIAGRRSKDEHDQN